MTPTMLTALRYELAYPVLRGSSHPVLGSGGLDNFSESERLEHLAMEQSDSVDRWLDVGEHWMAAGNFIRASRAFGRAYELRPESGEILMRRAASLATLAPGQSERDVMAAMALGAPRPERLDELPTITSTAGEEVATIYADMYDMVQYLAVNTSFSGIQRVVANILREVRRASGANNYKVIPVLPDYSNKIVYAADIELFYEIIDTVERGNPTRDHINRLLAAINMSLRRVEPAPSDIFLMAGAFWILPSYDLLKDLRQKDVKVTVFIHDLIQIDNPRYVQPNATCVFRRSLIDIAELTSFFTANSVFVAGQVRRFLQDKMGLHTPVHPVPLATEMSLISPEIWQDEAVQSQFGEHGYVLCVSTLEIRKNHLYLLRLWQELLLRKQSFLPTLVLVGKWGWEIDPFREALEECNYLDGRIKVMAAVTDTVLACLYRNCLFTIYPSFAEGWGLPIGESLAFGKPCIASGVTSMPEVGGDLVRYIDPLDLETGVAAVQEVLNDRPALAAWTERVRERFQQRSWASFAEHLLRATHAMAKDASHPLAFARLLPGEIAVLGHSRVEGIAWASRPLRTARMARDKGWRHNEEWGAWAVSPMATLRFVAEGCSPGTAIRVTLELCGPGDQSSVECRIISDVETTPLRAAHARPSFHECAAMVGEGGLVTIAVAARGAPGRVDEHDAFVCLSRMGYVRISDARDATNLMEAVHFEDWRA